MIQIPSDNLQILYRPVKGGLIQVWLIGVEIGSISFSETTKTYWIHYKNISDVVTDFNTKKEVVEHIKKTVIEFIYDVIGQDYEKKILPSRPA